MNGNFKVTGENREHKSLRDLVNFYKKVAADNGISEISLTWLHLIWTDLVKSVLV